MKPYYNILLITLVVLLVSSCNKSDHESGKPVASGVVTIQLEVPSTGTKAGSIDQGTAEENYIGITQVVFFTPTDDKSGVVERIIPFDAAKSSDDGQSAWDADAKKLSVKGINASKAKGVCVVANATTDNGYDMSAIKVGVTTEADLLKAITESTTLPSHPTMKNGMLMSYLVKEHDFSIAYTLKVPLTRQLLKINLIVKLNQAFLSHFPTTSFWDAVLNDNRFLNIYNIKDQSFVHITTPVSAPATSSLLNFMPIKDITQKGDAKLTEWHLTIYTYENPQTGNNPEDKNASTWFTLNLPYKNDSGVFVNNYYKFYINNTTDTNNPHKTLRNHIYDLTATVNGFGSLTPDDGQEVEVTTTVLDWNMLTMDDEVGDWVMTLNKTSVKLLDNVLNNSLIARVSTTLKEPLLPSLFSEITYPDGMTDDQKKLKLDFVRDADDKGMKITIQDTADKPYVGDGVATFYIQYGVYKKKITVNYSHASIILGYFGGNPSTNGWIYPNQLAVALVKAPTTLMHQSDKSENNIWIINSIKYGRGMNVFAAAVPSYKTIYPAFAYCADLNEDMNGNKIIDDSEMVWYLPSQNQLMAMYVFSVGMDISFDADSHIYWSASEMGKNPFNPETDPSSTTFKVFGIGTDGSSFADADISGYVRCVRDI